jgi:hypothetical protein
MKTCQCIGQQVLFGILNLESFGFKLKMENPSEVKKKIQSRSRPFCNTWKFETTTGKT